MASLKRIWTLSLACGGLLLCGQAVAQIAPGTGDKGPIDVSGHSADRFDAMHLTVWHSGPSGPVEVDQNGARLVCDTLYIYSYAPGEAPPPQGQSGSTPAGSAAPAPTPAPAKPAAASAATPADDTVGNIKQMIAEGHAFYVTQNETARGERMVYDAEPDTITLTGGVVVVQGKNVLRGDKMVIDRKSGQTTMVSDATGRNTPGRVRGVFYNDNQNQNAPATNAQGQPAPAPASGQAAAKAPAAPSGQSAKKP
jgi:lipopolysaccharide export system protein LptA